MHGMSTWNPDPDLLRTFLAVRKHQNLTRAAEELYVSQPAVSRRVARLERSVSSGSDFDAADERPETIPTGDAPERGNA